MMKLMGESASYYEQDGKLVFFCDNNGNGEYDKKLEKKFVYKKACKEQKIKKFLKKKAAGSCDKTTTTSSSTSTSTRAHIF
ncbi:unnamed protein product [Oikopleura dioica]|uniref:Uncharacterized protein n=1 Tax=Oikopleura dioica TaxID=34765 RepID=E4X780_OIKDI|nr:unnamed protein product [Oikopleura dioica]